MEVNGLSFVLLKGLKNIKTAMCISSSNNVLFSLDNPKNILQHISVLGLFLHLEKSL